MALIRGVSWNGGYRGTIPLAIGIKLWGVLFVAGDDSALIQVDE